MTTTTRPTRQRRAPHATPTPEWTHINAWIPGHPVSVNAMYGARRGTYAKRLTAEASDWRDAIANSFLRWRVPERAPRPQLAVSFTLVGVRGDADNYAKLICDGVKIGLMVDDRYFTRVTATKRKRDYPGEAQGVAVYVTRLDEAPAPSQPGGDAKGAA